MIRSIDVVSGVETQRAPTAQELVEIAAGNTVRRNPLVAELNAATTDAQRVDILSRAVGLK